MAAMKHHRGRALVEQRVERNQPAVVIRQQKVRHGVADPGRVGAAVALSQSLHQLVDGAALGRKDLAARGCVAGQTLLQRRFEVAVMGKRLGEALIDRHCGHGSEGGVRGH